MSKARKHQETTEALRSFDDCIAAMRRAWRDIEAEMAKHVTEEFRLERRLVKNVNSRGRPLSEKGRRALLTRYENAIVRVSALAWEGQRLCRDPSRATRAMP